jgi:hypothetical protein
MPKINYIILIISLLAPVTGSAKSTSKKQVGKKILIFTPDGKKNRPRVLLFSRMPDTVSTAPILLKSNKKGQAEAKNLTPDAAKIDQGKASKK